MSLKKAVLKLQYIIMAFTASSFRVTEEDWLSETDPSGPHSFFWMFLLLLKELIIIFLFGIDLVYLKLAFPATKIINGQ